MRQDKTVTVRGSRAIETQRFYELNGYRVKSWTVLSGRKIRLVLVKK
jgi:hypothetical protein